MIGPTGEQIHLTDTELRVVLESIDAHRLPYGPDEVLRTRARKKIAQALEIASRPFVEAAKR